MFSGEYGVLTHSQMALPGPGGQQAMYMSQSQNTGQNKKSHAAWPISCTAQSLGIYPKGAFWLAGGSAAHPSRALGPDALVDLPLSSVPYEVSQPFLGQAPSASQIHATSSPDFACCGHFHCLTAQLHGWPEASKTRHKRILLSGPDGSQVSRHDTRKTRRADATVSRPRCQVRGGRQDHAPQRCAALGCGPR